MAEGRDRDDFWDIEKLLPKRKEARLSPFATGYQTVTYEPEKNDRVPPARPAEERKLTDSAMRGVRQTEDRIYAPSGAGLIKRVTVKRSIDKYDFYDSFRKAALLYFDYNAPKCDFAQFYSYMPQYAHLTPSQKNYYFWWRSQLREGKYIKTDYSYLYLYVYEILNLPDKIPPKEGIRLLCRVWREYRKSLPRIDSYFAIWIEDYCLVHALPCPASEISDFLFDCIGTAPLKEFFLSDVNEVGLSGTETLIAYLSDYDWRKGKYAAGELAGSTLKDCSYRDHMIRAMYLLLSEIWNEAVLGDSSKRTTLMRDAFPSTLCTHSVKCKLEIEYISFSESAELREAITAAVRYTENKLRALLGVKSRLAVKGLPPEYSAVIDRYFARYMAEEQKRREIASRPEYERLYEAPEVKMSLGGAAEIERMSWENAKLLVVEADELVYADALGASSALDATSDIGDTQYAAHQTVESKSDLPLGEEETSYLKALLGMGGIIPGRAELDSIAERINEAFVDIIGDVLLEPGESGYQIIDDYREEATKLICSLP